MVTWAQKIAFVGMTCEDVPPNQMNYTFNVMVRFSPKGLCSYGRGSTHEKALECACVGLPMDWNSVTRKITDKEWELIAHM